MSETASPIGRRIQVVGMTNAGKSTLGARLGRALGIPYTDLDALYWKPGWQSAEDAEWHPKLAALAATDAWIVSGNYWRHTREHLLSRLETIVWLELPLRVLLPRVVRRSWTQYRSQELLWGSNREHFLDQLMLWDQERSLIAYALFGRKRLHDRYLGAMSAAEYAHVRIVRLRSVAEVEMFARSIEDGVRAAATAGTSDG